MTWWGSYGRGVSFEGVRGEHGAGERAHRTLNDPVRGCFRRNPGFIIFDVIVYRCISFFVFVRWNLTPFRVPAGGRWQRPLVANRPLREGRYSKRARWQIAKTAGQRLSTLITAAWRPCLKIAADLCWLLSTPRLVNEKEAPTALPLLWLVLACSHDRQQCHAVMIANRGRHLCDRMISPMYLSACRI